MQERIIYQVRWINHKPINVFETLEEAEQSLEFPKSSFYIKRIDLSGLNTKEQIKKAMFQDYWDFQAERERERKIRSLKRSMEEDPQFKEQFKEEFQCSGI